MKIRWTGKALPDDSGTNGLAVLLDQLTIGLLRKEKLCETGHYERIHKAEQYGGCDCHQHSSQQIFLHGKPSYTSPARVMNMSISLIPMKGITTPPAP